MMENILNQLKSVLYPEVCVVCRNLLKPEEKVCCELCKIDLPKVALNDGKQNEIAEKVRGRIDAQYYFSLYYFKKDAAVQEFLHYIKYKNAQRLAKDLGRELGQHILTVTISYPFTHILPLPLHPHKEKERGYNQATLLALGLSDVLHIPVASASLVRTKNTSTQTQKSRLERIENVKDAFLFTSFQDDHQAEYHYLLIDDVLTTGATLESAIDAIKTKEPQALISIATLALATDI